MDEDTRMKTIHENERDYIITVLKKMQWPYMGRRGCGGGVEYSAFNIKIKNAKTGY
ncbi:MAG: hypothetical protein WDO71_00885 [Bacteroidota bacterium]